MIFHLPDYYEKFNCIAGECPDSCCHGWRTIEVDERSFERYCESQHEYAPNIRSQLKSLGGKYFFKLQDGKCPFLNEDNLCDIIVNIDEGMLCTTCATYPRFVYTRGNDTYACLAMSCPHAAQMILNHDGPIEVCKFDDQDDSKLETEEIATIKLIYDEIDIPLWMKMALLALIPVGEQSYYDEQAMDILRSLKDFPAHSDIRIQLGIEYLNIFKRLAKSNQRMERIHVLLNKYVVPSHHDIVDQVECLVNLYSDYDMYVHNNIKDEVDKEFKNYIAYKLFRSIPEVMGHDDFYDELFMIIMSCVGIFMLQAMMWKENGEITTQDRIDIFQCHAKTFEHSEKMQHKIKEKFKNDGYMTPAVMLALIVPHNRY